MKRQLLKLFGLAALSGCAQAQTKSRSVGTTKFNYTGWGIDNVMVDGAWTGGVDAYSGGGKFAQGLLAPSDPNRASVLNVTWEVSGLYDIEKNTYSRTPVEQHQAKVEVARPYPVNPDYLVLHFYPDGHVEAELEADRPKRRIPTPPGYHR
ncbi:DUF3304 domain-containing protein [Undibacterium sp.]|uniref:DUF3304 domain-containing protein n=1 Tax=Undibacterium sp. TaxID=1914977 RepID=UPI0025FCC365|nr:DUF3304 domain-containing protein [Undibacterium sp.]